MQLTIAVAILQNQQGEVLLSGRNTKDYLSQQWEFPGGKIEAGESPEQALFRELKEELGIQTNSAQPLIQTQYQYPQMQVTIHAYYVSQWSGEIQPQEHQNLKWVIPSTLLQQNILAASLPVIHAFTLPDSYIITPSEQTASELKSLANQHPNSILQYRDVYHEQNAQHYLQNAQQFINAAHQQNSKVMLNADINIAITLGADGVHLNQHRMQSLQEKPERLLVSGSCHNAEEVEIANQLKLDWIVLSPVCKTKTHPDANPLGWEKFKALVAQANMPVYALGGVTPKDITQSQSSGGQGIAGIRCFSNI